MRCNNSSFSGNDVFLLMRCDWSEAKSKWASLDTVFWCPRTIYSWAHSVYTEWLLFNMFFFNQGMKNTCWLPLHSMQRAATMSYSLWPASDSWPTQTETEGLCFALSDAFSPVRYIQRLANWRKIMKTERQEIHYFIFFLGHLLVVWQWYSGMAGSWPHQNGAMEGTLRKQSGRRRSKRNIVPQRQPMTNS